MKKYARSLHARCSAGTTSDDRFMPTGYGTVFSKMKRLVLTEKLDGQNNCLNKDGVFARSHAAPSALPWDKPLWERWNLIKNDLKDLEIFGENMYGVHSIAYSKLESYFYVFAIREKGYWLSWDAVKFYASLLDFPVVPEIPVKYSLKDSLLSSQNEDEAVAHWLAQNLGMPWEKSVKLSGKLGGYDPKDGKPCSEGFVIRNAEGFYTNNGILPVQHNEFDSLFKVVRKGHVKTDKHWTRNWKPATLTNYERYGWHAYQYLSKTSFNRS
ncbi:2'-5' RNA ligase [Fulvitalea axinellae]|uniref:2'-5' RNA ligase n=1 Tax=Fulvitalea axinellae TaxID=1182444 RepID=A0AAU9DEE4_9BACT|nr:2'-5' RNA ligase [Fulvitalea axinellae]